MLTPLVNVLQGAASREVGCIIMRYFIHISVWLILIQEQPDKQDGSEGRDRADPPPSLPVMEGSILF